MENIQKINDISKEVLTILAYFDKKIIEKIPTSFLDMLKNQAANSTNAFYINPNSDISEQNISEESKDLISLIYYSYIADENEKNEISKLWYENEEEYNQELREKYNLDSIFDNRKSIQKDEERNTSKELIVLKENWFTKFLKFIKKILKPHNN